MCGIFGATLSAFAVDRVIELLRHRGPDDSGAVRLSDGVLVHTRLYINAVFHVIAIGKPLIIFNPDGRVNWGHDRLFSRPDLPPPIILAQSWATLLEILQTFASGRLPLAPYQAAPSMVSHLFHSLDGARAEQISTALIGGMVRGFS